MLSPRFSEIDTATMTEAQASVYEAIKAGPRGGVAAPFQVLLQSPELADRVQGLGTYVRFNSVLPPRLSELAILITARKWDSPFEWFHHVRDGLAGGVPAAEIEAISERRRPDFDDPAAEALYDFCTELHGNQAVSDATFERAKATLGEAAIVDLIGILGHYSMIAMLLSTFEVPPPGPAEIALAD